MSFGLIPKGNRTMKDAIDVVFDDNEEVSEFQQFIYRHVATKYSEDHVPYEDLRPIEKKLIESINSDPDTKVPRVKVVNANELRQFIQNARRYFGNEGNYNWIDISDVTSLTCLFKGDAYFNGDITRWDTSNVINMNDTFKECHCFKRDLSRWDLSNVRFASNCFTKSGLSYDEKAKEMILSKMVSLPANYKKKSSMFYIF